MTENFTAAEVRAMMPNHKQSAETNKDRMMNYIRRKVKGSAIANNNSVGVSCRECMATTLNEIIRDLHEAGFKTVYDCEYDWLEIRW